MGLTKVCAVVFCLLLLIFVACNDAEVVRAQRITTKLRTQERGARGVIEVVNSNENTEVRELAACDEDVQERERGTGSACAPGVPGILHLYATTTPTQPATLQQLLIHKQTNHLSPLKQPQTINHNVNNSYIHQYHQNNLKLQTIVII